MFIIEDIISPHMPMFRSVNKNNNISFMIPPIKVPFIAHPALSIACKTTVNGDWI